MAKTERYKPDVIEAALRASGGIYSLAAVKIGCAPNTVKNYVERYPELQESLAEILFSNLDIAEAELLKSIQNGNMTAIIFYLKTKGKHRGYSEKYVVSGPNDGPIAISHGLELGDLRKLSTEKLLALESIFAALESGEDSDGPGGAEPSDVHPAVLAPD